MLLGAAAMFGGVYLWSALLIAGVIGTLLIAVKPRLSEPGAQRTLDGALAALLATVLLQAIPLPTPVVHMFSPQRETFVAVTSLAPPSTDMLSTLTLDAAATSHAWLSLFCMAATFWTARTLFARGGIRTFSTVIAWGAIAMAIVAFAQHASGTSLVYGFWRPSHTGSRPLGPFINRNHLGTWSILALFLCAGYLLWRDDGRPTSGSWRTRASRWLDARGIVLQLAIVLLASVIALGASRSALVALACAAGYVACVDATGSSARSPLAGVRARQRRFPLAALAACAIVAMLGYGDGQRLLLRVEETRTTGMANRVAIWRDTVPLIRDFPVTGVGAGAFETAMRVYQTSPRTYYHNEAHNQYLQLAAEGGLLLGIPAAIALGALVGSAWRQLRRRDDPLHWMRVAASGALVGVAVQSFWETGLTLPANGMLAAALAGLVVGSESVSSRDPSRVGEGECGGYGGNSPFPRSADARLRPGRLTVAVELTHCLVVHTATPHSQVPTHAALKVVQRQERQ